MIFSSGSTSGFYANTISPTNGGIRFGSKISWNMILPRIILCVSAAVGRVRPRTAAVHGGFMALRQHYSLIQIMDRLLEIIEAEDPEDNVEELYTLRYWLNVDRFDRKAVNKKLHDHARGENVFM